MPVVFKGRSEYDRHYRWNPSYRSASFTPKLGQSAIDAGLRSDEITSSQEPRITAKKKVWHREPQVQSCLLWWPETGTDDGSSIVGEDEVVTQVENGGASPVMKAYTKKERESRNRVKRHADKKRSKSLDISTTLDHHHEESKEKKHTSRKTVIEKNQEEIPPHEQSAKQNGNSSPKIKPNAKVSSEVTAKKQSSPKLVRAHTKSRQKDIADIQRSPKKPRKTSTNIVLQHKAGLHAGRPQRILKGRLTEYQRNFIPPKGAPKPSCVLTAQDIVHSSSTAIPPHSGIKFQSTSEYLQSYKPTVSSGEPNELPKKLVTSPASPSLKLKVKDIQKPYFASVKKNASKSEYASQYEGNTEFQVAKLREMAESNKQKHQGTHIDPDHATQVASPFNRCWEASSDGSQSQKTPSEADSTQKVGSDVEETPEEQWSRASQKGSDSTTLPEEDKQTEIEADSLDDLDSEISEPKTYESNQETKQKQQQNDKESVLSVTSKTTQEGRITTPTLQNMGGALRTHHDLTTPCKGGALLTSPPRRQRPKSTGSYTPIPSKSSAQMSYPIAGSPTRDEQKLLEGREHILMRSSPCQFPSGQPAKAYRFASEHTPEKSRQASTKGALATKGTASRTTRPSSHSPITERKRNTASLSSLRAPIRGALKNEEFQHCGPTGRVQTAPAFSRADHDALSVASSLTSARASELLRRAKERKSFWTTA